mgnify:CR=1 FL=1
MAIFQENKKASFQDGMKAGCLPNVKTINPQRKQALFVERLKVKKQAGLKASKKTMLKYFLLAIRNESKLSICTDGNQ